MSCASSSPLVLGGHSFIEQLGNEPAADAGAMSEIVSACLDAGILAIDTTYQPERVALGKCLAATGRGNEAEITVWNFFHPFRPGQDVGGPAPYQPHHLQQILDELQVDKIARMVVHPVESEPDNRRQIELALQWQNSGRVGQLGTWAPPQDAEATFGPDNPYDFMVCPYNIANTWSGGVFAACKRLGWENFACSPFGRGWELDKLLGEATRRCDLPITELRARLADHMLRFSLFGQNVDRLVVAMRRPGWVHANLASVERGPLREEELAWLQSLRA